MLLGLLADSQNAAIELFKDSSSDSDSDSSFEVETLDETESAKFQIPKEICDELKSIRQSTRMRKANQRYTEQSPQPIATNQGPKFLGVTSKEKKKILKNLKQRLKKKNPSKKNPREKQEISSDKNIEHQVEDPPSVYQESSLILGIESIQTDENLANNNSFKTCQSDRIFVLRSNINLDPHPKNPFDEKQARLKKNLAKLNPAKSELA